MTKEEILAKLDSFTEQYIETALWSSTDPDTERPLDDTFGTEHLSVPCLKQMVRDCKEFQAAHKELWKADGKSDSDAGHDFWLTRNGHGAGFWDGDYPKNGDLLTAASKPYGTVDLMPYRNRIHC